MRRDVICLTLFTKILRYLQHQPPLQGRDYEDEEWGMKQQGGARPPMRPVSGAARAWPCQRRAGSGACRACGSHAGSRLLLTRASCASHIFWLTSTSIYPPPHTHTAPGRACHGPAPQAHENGRPGRNGRGARPGAGAGAGHLFWHGLGDCSAAVGAHAMVLSSALALHSLVPPACRVSWISWQHPLPALDTTTPPNTRTHKHALSRTGPRYGHGSLWQRPNTAPVGARRRRPAVRNGEARC